MIQIKDNPFQINFSESKLNHFDKENNFRLSDILFIPE